MIHNLYQLCFKIRLATVEFKFKFVYSHLFNYNIYNNKEGKKKEESEIKKNRANYTSN